MLGVGEDGTCILKKDFLKCERKASSSLLHHLLTQNDFKSHIIQPNKNA